IGMPSRTTSSERWTSAGETSAATCFTARGGGHGFSRILPPRSPPCAQRLPASSRRGATVFARTTDADFQCSTLAGVIEAGTWERVADLAGPEQCSTPAGVIEAGTPLREAAE